MYLEFVARSEKKGALDISERIIKFETIKYFKASQLQGIEKSSGASAVISSSDGEDNMAVLLTITNPVGAVNY